MHTVNHAGRGEVGIASVAVWPDLRWQFWKIRWHPNPSNVKYREGWFGTVCPGVVRIGAGRHRTGFSFAMFEVPIV